MESSTAIAFRALIMLIALVAVPLYAVFGTALPAVVVSALGGKISAPQPGAPLESGTTWRSDVRTANAPPYNPNTTAPAYAGTVPTSAPLPPQAAVPSSNYTVPVELARREPSNSPPAQFAAQNQVSPEIALIPRQPESPEPLTGGSAAMRRAEPPHDQNRAAPPLTTSPGSLSNSLAGTIPAAVAPANTPHGQFGDLERRLRELGAIHYVLETWGNQGEVYHFRCKMAVGGNPNFSRSFDATDADPMRAMAQVIQQAEDWHAGRIQ